jgi:hypothetical protein
MASVPLFIPIQHLVCSAFNELKALAMCGFNAQFTLHQPLGAIDGAAAA